MICYSSLVQKSIPRSKVIGNPIPALICFGSFSTSPSPSDAHYYKMNHKDWLSPNQVIKIFENLKDANSVALAWHQYSQRKDYKPNEALFTLVIKKLAQANNFDTIEDIMRTIKLHKPCRLSNDFFYNVIKVYGQLGGRIRKAIATLVDMPSGYNCWPDVKTFNLVLNLVVSAKLYDVVHEVYLQAPYLGVEIDACCLNILIKGLTQNGDLEAAFYVLDEFPKQRCKPNVRTFSTLMHGLCKNGKLEEAFGLLERMKEEGIDADAITFNILISGLRKRGRIEQGLELLEKMKLNGCEPNEASYQEVLYGLIDADRFVEAKELMSRMLYAGFSPSFVSYRKLIHGLCNEKLTGDADWVLGQMVKRGFVPKMGMWKHLMETLFSGGNTRHQISFGEIVGNEAGLGF